ncbi:alpha/beta hydrolase [Hellea sp.]|nr:alpha/beta hydrolase [Hellea sp.]
MHSNTLYFHGLPGSGDELRMAGLSASQSPKVIAPLDFQALDDFVAKHGKVRLVAFSLGAFSALQMAATRPGQISEIVLISPAAPLELGEFLENMAGAPIFKTARASKVGLKILTAMQSTMAFIAPKILMSLMFAESCDADKDLLNNPVFVSCLTAGLRQSLHHNAKSYRHTLAKYVQPWAQDLGKVQCDVTIYHGRLDNWAPIAMAEALKSALSGRTELIIEPKQGHYSTLLTALPKIFAPA